MVLRIGTDASGIDAPVQALKDLGVPFVHCFSSDVSPDARKVILANSKPLVLYDDLTAERPDLPDIDMYVAGPPCQPFSLAGKREGSAGVGGRLFESCLDVVLRKKPALFVLENVQGILSIHGGRYWACILERLAADFDEYHTAHALLNSREHGTPQNRKRVYLVGILKSRCVRPFRFPEPIALTRTIEDIVDRTEVSRKRPRFNEKISRMLEANPNTFVHLSYPSAKETPLFRPYSPCLLANSNLYCNELHRRANVREHLRLQAFPDDFVCAVGPTKMKKLIGNSMTVSVLRRLFRACFAAMDIDVPMPANEQPAPKRANRPTLRRASTF